MSKALPYGFHLLFFLFFCGQNFELHGQCDNPSVALPDVSVPVNGNIANAYCVTLTFDPALSGFPTALSLGIQHSWQGDLALWLVADGNYLSIFQRPGVIGSCTGGCPCGNSADLGGTYIFSDGGGPNPENGMALGGGSYGVSPDDACGVGTPGINSFADLWATYGPGEIVTATLCISDHAGADSGFASDITFIFPNPVFCGCTDGDAINFDPNAVVDDGSCIYDCPNINPTVNQATYTFCAGMHNFTMSVSAPGAMNPSYFWEGDNGGDAFLGGNGNSSISVSIPPDFTGDIVYTVTVTDEFGCEYTAEVNVTVGEGPDVEIIGDDVACVGGTTVLSLSGGPFTTRMWSTGSSGTSVTVGPGNYSVTVTDPSGCLSVANFTIDPLPLPTPNIIGPALLCPGGDAILELDDSYSNYSWSNGQSTPDIVVTSPGTYRVTVYDDNNCPGIATFTLNGASPIVVNITGGPTFCEGEGIILNAGPTYATYDWSTGENFSEIFVSDADVYSVTVTDFNGCEGSGSVTITETPLPEPTITGPDVLCEGSTIQLGLTSGYSSYEWSTGSTTSTTVVDFFGTYSVTVTNSQGCAGETTYDIIEGETVDAEVEGDLFFCPGSSTDLSITPGYTSYQWAGGPNTDERTITQEGTYVVTVTSADGCTQVLDFFVDQLPNPMPTISGPAAICEGESADLIVNGLYDLYDWSTGDAGFEINVDEAGLYSVTVTDDNGCEGQTNFNLTVNSLLDLQINGPAELCNNVFANISISGSFNSVQWDNGITSNINPIAGPGFYEVNVIDNNGCPAYASIDIAEGFAEPIDITGDAEICANSDGQLTASAGFVSYSWSNGANTATITVTDPGIFTVLATDANGCESQESFSVIEVPALTPTISGDLTICPGASTVLTTPGSYVSYSWSTGGNGSQTTVSSPGPVTLTVVGSTGCAGQVTTNVVGVPNPTPQIQGDLILCTGESSTLSLTQAYPTYSWSTGSTDPTAEATMGTTYSVTVTDAEGCQGSTSATAQVVVPTVSISGDNDFCAGQSTSLSVPASFASYAWSTGATTPQINTNVNGQVTVTVTDSNGCTATAAMMLTEYALPTVAIDGRLSFCPIGGTQLTATAGYPTYQWSNNQNTATIPINQANTYTVTVTDANGCQNTASAVVVEDAELDPVILGVPSLCAGQSTMLNVSGTYTSYSWSNSANTNAVTISQAGDYTVSVIDEFGCTGNTTITVTAFPLPTPTINGELDYCIGSSTTLNGGNSYAAYAWSVPNATAPTLTATAPGTYSLTVTDNNGCRGTTSANVVENPLPVPMISGTAGYCPGTTTTLSAGAGFASYAWSTGGSGTSVAVGTTGTVQVSVTDNNGCVGVAQLPVAEFTTNIPAINGTPQYCPGTTTTLTAQGGFSSYNWSTGSTQPGITTGAAGPLTLVVTDANGCSTSNSVNLSVYLVTPPTIAADPGFCAGTTADLEATPGYATYTWSNAANTPIISVNTGGVYEVSVTDANGCPSSAATSIVRYALPQPTIGGSTTFCIGNSTTLNAGANYSSYVWSTGSDQSEVIVNTPGDIGLTVTDANGCTGSTLATLNEATELSPVVSGVLDYCVGGSTVLSAGNGFATYLWSTGEQSSSITVTQPGNYTVDVTDAGGCAGTAAVDVVENPLPVPVISGTPSFCAGLSTVLNATPGFENYSWSTGAPTTMITVTTPATYSLTVTDANGCVNSTSQAVAELALPVFSIVGPTNFCVDSFTQLSVQPAFASYDWSVGGVGQTVQVSNGGTVGVTVTDAAGCTSSAAQQVATVPLPLADAGAPQILDCDVLSLPIGGVGSSTGSQFSYAWSGPGITPANNSQLNPTISTPGMYSLVVTNNTYGCTSEVAQVNVVDNAYTPQLVLQVVDVLDCATETVQIDARNSDSGPEFVYQWFDANLNPINGANSLIYNATTAQYYFLQILDTITGCENMENIEVEANELYPVAEAGLTQMITCSAPVVTLDGSGSQSGAFISYAWTSPSGGFIGSASGNMASANQPGWYYLVVTDELNNCANIDSVFVNQDVDVPLAVSSADFELDCNDPTTVINALGSSAGPIYSYQWYLNGNPVPGGTTPQLNVATPGNYTFLVTNTENDCTAETDVNITINAAAPQALQFITDTPTCAGDDDGGLLITGVQGGTPPFLYSVGGAPYGTRVNFNNLVAGNYDVVVEDATGCRLLSTITVPDGNDLRLELGPNQTIKEGELADIYPQISVDSSALVQISWQTLATLPCPGCIYQLDLALAESTQFFLSLRDENGCETRDNLTIFVNKDRHIFVPNAFSPNGDGDNDFLFIFADQSLVKIRSFLVFNRWGESVFEVYNSTPNDPRWGWDGNYRGQPVNAAVYVWVAEVEFLNGDVEIIKGDVVIMR
jgi:gliding motility-associated-like protein